MHQHLRPNVLRCLVIFLAMIASHSTDVSGQNRSRGKRAVAPKIRLPKSVREERAVDLDVPRVIRAHRQRVRQAARRLDRLVENQLLAEGIVPGSSATDETFLRRVYLDVAGRIPTLQEAQAFLDSRDPERREELVDALLESPGYVSHSYNFWADVLRLVDRPQPNLIADPYLAYVKDTIRRNVPYDQWVRQMLTADGKIWENPAVGYQLRDEGMPLAYVDNTVRVFLGTQIGCAQCHDHPFDVWTQREFYELAAFTAGTRTRIRKGDPGFKNKNPANALIQQARQKSEKGRVPGPFQRIARANMYVVSESPRKLRFPHDYAYRDAKPKQIVEPKLPWGSLPESSEKASPRQQFAAWVTSADNHQFSKTIVNRLWKRYFGIGLVEPVDDFRDDNACANEPLMEFLCAELVESGFDLREFQRMVLYSRAYQNAAVDYDPASGEAFYFQGPVVRRMTAEQVWDSLLTLAVRNPWPFQRPSAAEIAPLVDLDYATATYSQAKKLSEAFAETYFHNRYKRSLSRHAYKGNVLCRASELPSPVPAGHFLQQFGQGDRQTIGSAHQDPTVPQILAMFNGPITHVSLEAGSAIVDDVLGIDSTRNRIDAIFLSVLSRLPTSADRRVAASELGRQRNDAVGYGNIIWGLLNTREFLFIQ